MNEKLSLEEERRVLKKKLGENMNRKHLMEVMINKQFEKLKKLEISLEKIRSSSDDNLQTTPYALTPEQIES